MFKIQRYSRIFPVTILVLAVVLLAAAAPQTYTGVLSDTMCGAKHMIPGKTDAECTRQCVKANAKYALVVDKNVYPLSGSLDAASSLAGKRVRISGEKSGDTLVVKSMTATDK